MILRQILVVFSLIFLAFISHAQVHDFVEIPSKAIQFINRTTKQVIEIDSYLFAYEMKYNCVTPTCQVSSGTSSGESELRVNGRVIQTPMQRIPKMPRSGIVMLTYKLLGVCKGAPRCAVTLRLDQFVQAKEPVVFAFDFDPAASAQESKKRKQARHQYFADIQKEMGRDMSASRVPQSVETRLQTKDWKQIEIDFNENRKKMQPMTYSSEAMEKFSLQALLCTSTLKQKIDKCEAQFCVLQTSDLIVHGYNNLGNCTISAPNGKRYFVPKADLPFFYEALTNYFNKTDSEKKTNLLEQLDLRKLSESFTPIKIGYEVSGPGT